MTPHGFLKAAMAGNPTAMTRMQGNRKTTIISFTALGRYINGTINDQNQVELVQTWIANPVLGDTLYETRYSDYKDFAGVKFPTVLHSHYADVPSQRGPQCPGNQGQQRPAERHGRGARRSRQRAPGHVTPARVESQKLADGVWFLGGGSHNSLAVEFRDFIAIVDGPLSEERSLAVIAEVQKLVPNKPIRYLVNTHHHFDHSGGLRAYVAEGATIVTHQGNRAFYEDGQWNDPEFLESLRRYGQRLTLAEAAVQVVALKLVSP
jgi:Metallo-beta-lactamase superfamily